MYCRTIERQDLSKSTQSRDMKKIAKRIRRRTAQHPLVTSLLRSVLLGKEEFCWPPTTTDLQHWFLNLSDLPETATPNSMARAPAEILSAELVAVR